MKKIGLFSYENTNFPNLALMKLSAYHKSIGNEVEWWQGPMFSYDKIYASKVFTWSKINNYLPKSTVKSGTGFFNTDQKHIKLKNKIEHICPDYSIYPNLKASYGFITRGCPNKCKWCFVPKKEGKIQKHADIEEFLKHKNVILMDNNILAHDWGVSQLEKISKMDIKIDCNQGLDSRLIDNTIAKLLSKIKWYFPIRLACDTTKNIENVRKAIELLRWHNATPRNYFVYVLIDNIESGLERIKFLKGMYVTPFAQPYIDISGKKPKRELRDFARWVNTHRTLYSCSWEEYKFKIGYKKK